MFGAGVVVLMLGCEAGSSQPAGDTEGTHETEESAGPGDTDTEGQGALGPLDGSVTFYRDVQPILEQHCRASCHEPGTIAPFSLTSYEEAWPMRELIAAAVQARTMPPWFASDDCADYVGDRSLSDAEIQTLITWADEEGPMGRPEDYVAPTAPDRPGLSRVDVSLQLPEPYEPQRQPDDYRCFLLDWPEQETTFITGFKAVPGNTNIVHHVITYAVDPEQVAEFEALDEAEPGPGYTCYGGPGATESDWTAGRWIGAWAPGGEGSDLPAGTGLRMEPGSKVVVQVHYNSQASDGQPDQTQVQYKVDASVENEAHMMLWADPQWLYGSMDIPAGAPSTVHSFAHDPTQVMSFLTDVIPENAPFYIHNVAHHMHKRGVRGLQTIERADGSNECLLELPRYDFDWQSGYRLADPIRFEPGDTLHLECEWNNEDNDQDVNWGEGTEDEMCLAVLYITAAD